MNTPKPPLRCPCCQALPAELIKRWGQHNRPGGKVLRFPVNIVATYHCGATIEAQYIINELLSGSLGGAYWKLVSTSGCRNAVASAMRRRSS